MGGGKRTTAEGLFAKKGAASAAGFSDQRSGTIERALEAVPASATVIPGARLRDEPLASAEVSAPAPTTAPPPRPAVPAAPPTQTAAPRRTTLLVVEDDPLNLKVLSEVLTHRGFRVLAARTGPEAVEMAISHRPELVLMDLRLPGGDGLEASRRLKGDPELAGVGIIALTAYVRDWPRRSVLAAGCDDVLAKPVPLETLEAAIAAALGRRAESVDARAAVS